MTMDFIYRLLSYKPFSGAVKPESALALDVRAFLTAETLNGNLDCVWFHVPNEGKLSKTMRARLKAEGVISGCPDYVFAWGNGAGFIELKSPTRHLSLSDNQKDFKKWLDYARIKNYAVCTTVKDVEINLRAWGVLRSADFPAAASGGFAYQNR